MRQTRRCRVFQLSLTAIGAAVLIACASSSGSSANRNQGIAAAEQSRTTQQQVQSELMAFADRYFAATLEVAKTLEHALETPESRYNAAGARVLGLIVTTDIAASPNPGAALLDMTVFVTLKRIVWEEYWMLEGYGEAGQPVLETFRELEEDIWEIAAGVYTQEQLAELKKLIRDWRAQHPDVVSVDYVRLTELGDSRDVQTLMEAGRPGGMLAPVKEASRSVDEMRMLGERLSFMWIRMQLMISLQVDMASTRMALQPEVQQLLEDTRRFAGASDRFAETIAALAADLPHERRAAIEQLLSGLGEERKQLLSDLADEDGDLRTLLGEVRATVEVTRQLAEILNQTTLNADRLVARMLEEDPARPFDIMDYHATIGEATTTVLEVQEVLASIERLLSSDDTEEQLDPFLAGANRFEEEVIDDVIDRAFLRGVALIIVFFVVLSIYRFLMRRFAPETEPKQRVER